MSLDNWMQYYKYLYNELLWGHYTTFKGKVVLKNHFIKFCKSSLLTKVFAFKSLYNGFLNLAYNKNFYQNCIEMTIFFQYLACNIANT